MPRGLVPCGGFAVPVAGDPAAASDEGMLLSEEIWRVCRDASVQLPHRLRVELHTRPGEPRVAADAHAVRRDFAALLQRAAALLRSRRGVLEVAVLASATAPCTARAPVAWIAVRLLGEDEAKVRNLAGAQVGGPKRSKGGRPFRTERFGPPQLAPRRAPFAAGEPPPVAPSASRLRLLAPPE